MGLIAELKDKKAEMASWRQHLHQFPEIAYEEEMTSGFVAEKLESFGIEVHRGLGKTGVVGVIQGQDSGDGSVTIYRAQGGYGRASHGGADQSCLCVQTCQSNACLWP